MNIYSTPQTQALKQAFIQGKNETNTTALTKRLGEVDYTEVESLNYTYSANRNRVD